MKLKKRQIQRIRTALKRANKANSKMMSATEDLASVIIEETAVNGNVDHLMGDGFGFTPESNNDTHIPIDLLIEIAENGEDITEEVILKNLTI